jgi:hypothetical protein
MRVFIGFVVASLLTFGSHFAFAADVAGEKMESDNTRLPKAELPKDCAFATHNCEICVVEDGKTSCSSVGIACVPMRWSCLIPTEGRVQ